VLFHVVVTSLVRGRPEDFLVNCRNDLSIWNNEQLIQRLDQNTVNIEFLALLHGHGQFLFFIDKDLDLLVCFIKNFNAALPGKHMVCARASAHTLFGDEYLGCARINQVYASSAADRWIDASDPGNWPFLSRELREKIEKLADQMAKRNEYPHPSQVGVGVA